MRAPNYQSPIPLTTFKCTWNLNMLLKAMKLDLGFSWDALNDI